MMKRFRALFSVLDELLDELQSMGLYTHAVLGYVVASLDSFATVISVLLYSIYIILSHRDDSSAKRNLARFLAGFLAYELGKSILVA